MQLIGASLDHLNSELCGVAIYMGIRKTTTTVTQNRYYIRRWSQTGAIDFRPLAHAHSLLTSNR